MLFPTSLTLLLLPLLAAASDVFCEECGVNGVFYIDEGCTNNTYTAPLFGGDAGECFEIGAPYSTVINEVAHMPFGQSAKTKSVLIQVEKDGCESMFVPFLIREWKNVNEWIGLHANVTCCYTAKFYPGLQCKAGTGKVVGLGECASDSSSSGWGSFCVSCPTSSKVYGAGTSCP